MDAVRFGRWISQRRHAGGWRSQRAFVEMARQDLFLRTYNISEDFLARLEAGRLAHPFRKSIRRRVLALAGLLCKTPRELRTYLQAAELTDLNPDENDYVNRLNEQLGARRTTTTLLLPPRPSRLVGRTAQVHELIQTLWTLESGICAVTGMPGVGKSALAAEAVHQVAINERERVRIFPDGIATFSGTGRRGVHGLIALLQEIIAVFSPSAASTSQATGAVLIGSRAPLSSGDDRLFRLSTTHTAKAASNGHDAMLDMLEADLAGAIDRARQVLAGKRVLLVLDDMDVQFPLRQACEALLAQEQKSAIGRGGGSGNGGQCSRVVLITSRYIPAPTLLMHRLHLEPLEPQAALELFVALIGHALSNDEHSCVEQICAAVGYLPLAIEAAAAAATIAGIPLSLLAERVMDSPLDALLDGEGEVHFRLAQALANFDPQMQQRFALLSTLGTQVFALENAAALRTMHPEVNRSESYKVHTHGQCLPEHSVRYLPPRQDSQFIASEGHRETAQSVVDVSSTHLASTAADLGQFVRHSLVEIVPYNSPTSFPLSSRSTPHKGSFYQLHPLLHAYAMDRLEQLEPEVVHTAQRNLQSYALAYVEHYCQDVSHLEREREFLLAVLTRMWHQEQYPLVVHFLADLLPLIGRLGNYEQSERILHWGIRASQQTKDQLHLALFLDYLGKLHLHHGQLTSARHMLEQSLAIAQTLRCSARLCGPFGDLAHIAHILGDVSAARDFTETYVQRALETDDHVCSVIARYLRGFYERLEGDLDKAYDDVHSSLHLFAELSPDTPFHKDTFGMSVRAELARIEGDYARSKEYTETVLLLEQDTGQPYILADLLYDQACFAKQQGVLDDARTLALRVMDMASQIGASHLHSRAVTLLRLEGLEPR